MKKRLKTKAKLKADEKFVGTGGDKSMINPVKKKRLNKK